MSPVPPTFGPPGPIIPPAAALSMDRRLADVVDVTAQLLTSAFLATRPEVRTGPERTAALRLTLNAASSRFFELRTLVLTPESVDADALLAALWELCDLVRVLELLVRPEGRDHDDLRRLLDASRQVLLALVRVAGTPSRPGYRDVLVREFLALVDTIKEMDAGSGTFSLKLLDPALQVFLLSKRPASPDWSWLHKVLGSTARLRAGEEDR